MVDRVTTPATIPGCLIGLCASRYCERVWTDASVLFSIGSEDCASCVFGAARAEGTLLVRPTGESLVWLGPRPKLISARLSGINLVCQPWSD